MILEIVLTNLAYKKYQLGIISWGTPISMADFSTLSNPALIPMNNNDYKKTNITI